MGWELVCIPLELQLDGWNCGPWSHAALELFVRYFEQGASGGFEAFFNANAAVRAVNGLQPRSQAYRQAAAINAAYVGQVRDEMRRALRSAHTAGDMPFQPVSTDGHDYWAGQGTFLRTLGASAEESIPLSPS